MCGLMKAYGPRVTQTALFSSAPTASTGRDSNGSRTGNGAYPRERRMGTSPPAATRLTESSHRTWIGRSWSRNASAMSESRPRASALSVAMGSSLRFPLVMTSGGSVPSGVLNSR